MMHVETHGPADAETLLLCAGLGGSATYWADNIASFADRYRVVTYDQRGTGRSPDTLPDPTSIDAMAEDAAEILDQLGVVRCRIVGHALGGLIGLALAARIPHRISHLVIVNGWLRADAHTVRCFDVRRDLLLHCGVAAWLRAQPLFLYPSSWMAEHAERLARDEAHALAQFAGADNILRRIDALLRFDGSALLADLACRTLLVMSNDDMLVPPRCSQDLQSAIAGAHLVRLDGGPRLQRHRPRAASSGSVSTSCCANRVRKNAGNAGSGKARGSASGLRQRQAFGILILNKRGLGPQAPAVSRGRASGLFQQPAKRALQATATLSAFVAPLAPSGLSAPSVVSRAVWCSISASISAPTSTTLVDSQIQVMKPMAAPSDP